MLFLVALCSLALIYFDYLATQMSVPIPLSAWPLFLVDFSRLSSVKQMSDWYGVVNLAINQYVMWRSDPVIVWISGLLTNSEGVGYRPDLLLNMGVFWIGASLLYYQFCKGRLLAILASLVAVTSISITFGLDRVLIESLTWVPYLALVLRMIVQASQNTSILLKALQFLALIFLSCRVSASANQLSLIWISAGWLWASLDGNWKSNSRIRYLALLIAFLPALFTPVLAPSASIPDYPSFAHVVPDDGLAGFTRPLLGPDLPLQTINREAVKHGGYPLLVALLILMAGFLRWTREPAGWPSALLEYSLYAGILSLALDLFLPESLSEVAPLLTLARTVPGWFPFSLDATVAIFAITSIYLILVKRRAIFVLAVFSLVLVASAQRFPLNPISSKTAIRAHLRAANHALLSAAQKESAEALLASPSYYVINYFGYDLMQNRLDIEKATAAESLSKTNFKINSSDKSEARSLARLSDGKDSSRWSPKTGKQTGNEWLELVWDEPLTIRGLDLAPGKFSADFPRGLRISYQEGCSLEEQKSANYIPLLSYPNWQGPLEFTEQGYPYFGAQSQVRVYFPEPVLVKCLLVEQTGITEAFDWSVAEVGLIY